MFCWSNCIDCLVKTLSTNLVCTFRKFYTVTTWALITAYKPEYLSCWLNVIKKNRVAISVHLKVFNHDIFLCLQFICCVFCSDLKSENMRDSVQKGWKKWRSIEILFFVNLGLISNALAWKKKRLQNVFDLISSNKDFKMKSPGTKLVLLSKWNVPKLIGLIVN